MAQLMAAVAEERDKIGTEPPVDVEDAPRPFAGTIAETVVAEASSGDSDSAGGTGYGVLGLVGAEWRGRGRRLGSRRSFPSTSRTSAACTSSAWTSGRPSTRRAPRSTGSSGSSRREYVKRLPAGER